MALAAQILVAFVALEHVLFLVLEMFLWTTPFGRKSFGLTEEFAKASASLAKNQGLYNGFLATGLVWSLLLGTEGKQIALFFLGCVVIAGIFGSLTAKRSILFVQALPASIALALVLWGPSASV